MMEKHPVAFQLETSQQERIAELEAAYDIVQSHLVKAEQRVRDLEKLNLMTDEQVVLGLKQRIAELEGILSGDPDCTATKEQREAWRLSAVRYGDKLEQRVAELETQNSELRSIDAMERIKELEERIHGLQREHDISLQRIAELEAVLRQYAEQFPKPNLASEVLEAS